MKSRTIIITFVLTVALAATGPLFAQRGPGGGFGGPGGMGGPGGFGGAGLMHFEEMLPRLTEYLELTDGQVAQIEAILEAELPAIQSLRDELREARDAFRQSHEPGEFDEATFRVFAESQARLHVEIAVASARTMSGIYNVLTPDQQEKLQDLRGLMGRGHGARRGGGQMKP